MNIRQALVAFEHAIRNQIKVLFVGKPATAKTAGQQEVVVKLGWNAIWLTPSIADPTDFKGMPCTVVQEGKTVAEFLPFGDVQDLLIDRCTGPTVCGVDDVGQAPFTVQAALMPFIQERKIGKFKMHDEVRFCGATNSREDGAGVQGIIEPLKTRFHTLIPIEPSAEDFTAWMVKHKRDERVIAFLRTHPQEVHVMPKNLKQMDQWPNYRTWDGTARWLESGYIDIGILQGTIGKACAGQFWTFLELTQKCPDVNRILKDPKGTPVPEDVGLKHAVSLALLKVAKPENLDTCLIYMARLDRRFEVFFMKDVVESDKKLTQTATFAKWVSKNEDIFQ